jgi:hypothetical protein
MVLDIRNGAEPFALNLVPALFEAVVEFVDLVFDLLDVGSQQRICFA